MTTPVFEGPLEKNSASWPQELTARVVTPSAPFHAHGYDLESDWACHYDAGELVLLALTGEAPSEEAGRVFSVVVAFAAPVPVTEAPAHAALLARISGGRTAAIVSVAAIALAEEARQIIAEHSTWLEWLNGPRVEPPTLAPPCDADREAVRRLHRALTARSCTPSAVLDLPLTRRAAIVAAWHQAGLTAPHQLEAAWVHARLPLTLAEAFAQSPLRFDQYPINLPRYVYTPNAGSTRSAV